jgi:hypothetical protein
MNGLAGRHDHGRNQAAIWEVMYDGTSSLGLGGGNFYLTNLATTAYYVYAQS